MVTLGPFSNSMSRSHLVTMSDQDVQEKLIYSDDDAGQSSSEGNRQRSSIDTEQSHGRDRHSRRYPNKRLREEQRTLWTECDDRILKELEKICSGMEMIESRVSQLECECQRTSLTQSAKKHRPTESREMRKNWATIDSANEEDC